MSTIHHLFFIELKSSDLVLKKKPSPSIICLLILPPSWLTSCCLIPLPTRLCTCMCLRCVPHYTIAPPLPVYWESTSQQEGHTARGLCPPFVYGSMASKLGCSICQSSKFTCCSPIHTSLVVTRCGFIELVYIKSLEQETHFHGDVSWPGPPTPTSPSSRNKQFQIHLRYSDDCMEILTARTHMAILARDRCGRASSSDPSQRVSRLTTSRRTWPDLPTTVTLVLA